MNYTSESHYGISGHGIRFVKQIFRKLPIYYFREGNDQEWSTNFIAREEQRGIRIGQYSISFTIYTHWFRKTDEKNFVPEKADHWY